MNAITGIFLIEWVFTPTDYFEDPVEFQSAQCAIRVQNGRAEARISPYDYPVDHSLRNELHAELDARFLAAQVLNHKPYTLAKPSVAKVYPDGRRDAWVFPEGADIVIMGDSADVVIQHAKGNVISDTRKQRIERRIGLAQLFAQCINDEVANSIIRSYGAAVNDPKNEFIHLYEILESLKRHFGGKTAATAAVEISGSQWRRLHQIANDEPFSQGRHRGKHIGSLRDATASELSEARDIAHQLIEGYLRHLHKGTG